MIMAISVSLPYYLTNVALPSSKSIDSTAVALGVYAMLYRPTSAFGHDLNSRYPFFCIPHPRLANNSKRITWSIRSNVDSNGLDPSSTNGTTGTARLIRVIQAIRSNLGAKIGEIRRGLPMKVMFFLVGFYCATAYATVIGQTGDWDILSAAFAVLIVEGIGALMYKGSLPFLKKTKNLISKFNYWKAGLAMGLFLDSFKFPLHSVGGSRMHKTKISINEAKELQLSKLIELYVSLVQLLAVVPTSEAIWKQHDKRWYWMTALQLIILGWSLQLMEMVLFY